MNPAPHSTACGPSRAARARPTCGPRSHGSCAAWSKQTLGLVFVEERQIRTPQGTLISVDGAQLHALGVPFDYREAKDERDDLHAEIAAKFRKGDPRAVAGTVGGAEGSYWPLTVQPLSD